MSIGEACVEAEKGGGKTAVAVGDDDKGGVAATALDRCAGKGCIFAV